MKKLLLPSILLAALFVVACTRFDEPVMVQETENERTAPRTRSGGEVSTFDTLPNPLCPRCDAEKFGSLKINV